MIFNKNDYIIHLLSTFSHNLDNHTLHNIIHKINKYTSKFININDSDKLTITIILIDNIITKK